MGCIIEKYPNTKLWEKLLEIEADILSIIHERLSCTQNSPSLAGTGETIRFSVSVIDNDTGPIAEDELVAGTYDLIRIRNNVETTIVNDGAFSKRDGFIYIDIDFDTATWDLDDSYMLIPNQDSTAVIDGTTYYLPLAAWSGMILDLSGLETAVDTIISTLGTPAGDSIAEDIADTKAVLVDSLGSAVEGTATGLNLTAAGGATSSEDGADVLTYVTQKRKEILFLGVSMANITAAATVNVRMYTKVLDADVVLTKFYDEDFTQGTDPDLIPVIDGSMGIRNDLRAEMHSTAAKDTSVSIPFHYIYKNLE